MNFFYTLIILLFSFNLYANDEINKEEDKSPLYSIKYTKYDGNDYSFIGNVNEDTEYQVLYFFSYGCPACYHFEPFIKSFENNLPEKTEFMKVPVTNLDSWTEYTKAFYLANSLNVDVRDIIFDYVHDKNNKILLKTQLQDFFYNFFNVDNSKFISSYNSYLLTYKINKSEELADLFHIDGTPQIVIIKNDGTAYKTSIQITDNDPFSTILTLNYITMKDKLLKK